MMSEASVARELDASALRRRSLRSRSASAPHAPFPSATLTREPIELNLNVVLVGSAALYELACTLKEDMRKLFRVKAEFDWPRRGAQSSRPSCSAAVGADKRGGVPLIKAGVFPGCA